MDSRHELCELLKLHIQSQDERLAEKDAAIADLLKLVEELQFLKANPEETLNEFRRPFFGIRSEKNQKDIPQEEQIALKKMESIGYTQVREEIRITPAKVERIKI